LSSRSGWRGALEDLLAAFVPLSLREVEQGLEDRVRKIPTRLNEFGYDPWGLHPDTVRRSALPALVLYKYYFRVETHGIEGLPPGRVLLIANHAGQLPFDAAMISMAMLLEAEPPRIVRGMAEYWLSRLPWMSVLAARGGGVSGTPETCAEMLEAEEGVLVFPEGVRGINKPYSERYQLQRFGLGFMRLALETQTPVVPVAVVGSEEQQPGLANWKALGRLLGMPSFPVTPTFPWLGPLGLLPLPVRYHLYFGEPMHFEGAPSEEDSVVEEKVEQVKEAIADLLERGRRERKGVFR
jgi:1-acyl-sn-glycerol-3-phosphate acyltransferase